MKNPSLFGKTLAEIEEIVASLGAPAFTARQIAEWMYKKHITQVDAMTNLPKSLRHQLAQSYSIELSTAVKVQTSVDGTKKYLYPSTGHTFIETAYIPEGKRATLCVSSQVGCKMGCLFCMTGKQGFQGQLSTGEIINQIRSLPERETLSNIVFMGMGEPFDNLENVMKSCEILTADWGYGWSPKRITVSTIGIIPAMKTFIENSSCHLAVSMHTPFHAERKKIMPIENVYPIQAVVDLLRRYDLGKQRRLSFEYIMFKDFNDSNRHIQGISRLLHGMRCRINLIRFHPIPNSPLASASEERIQQFREGLVSKGFRTTIRASRGEDILAACGLLSTKELVKTQAPDF